MNNTWRSEIMKRFGSREDLGKLGLFERYFRSKGLPEHSVIECLNLLEDANPKLKRCQACYLRIFLNCDLSSHTIAVNRK